jgi:trehalose-6-phosphate synthase
MRQVLAKNPQVEQKTVFLEVIHPEKQDLKVNVADM